VRSMQEVSRNIPERCRLIRHLANMKPISGYLATADAEFPNTAGRKLDQTLAFPSSWPDFVDEQAACARAVTIRGESSRAVI